MLIQATYQWSCWFKQPINDEVGAGCEIVGISNPPASSSIIFSLVEHINEIIDSSNLLMMNDEVSAGCEIAGISNPPASSLNEGLNF